MFDIEGGKIKLSADTLAIPPFAEHFNNAEDKAQALKEIEYIVWCYKWDTPYKSYPPKEREAHVAKDVFKLDSYNAPERILSLSKRFMEFQNTSIVRLYNAAEEGLEFLVETLEGIKADMADNGSMPLEDKLKIAAGVSKILKDVEPTAKALDSGKKRAMAEQIESGKVKGGGTIGLFEIPR